MNSNGYTVPAGTRIGHVHLKVSDLQRSIDFYCGLLGFERTMEYGDQAAFISAMTGQDARDALGHRHPLSMPLRCD